MTSTASWSSPAAATAARPRQRLEDWSGFAKCTPEADGLREVQVRFDDEQEYIGKAIADDRYADQRGSTRVAGHPVILSALFDDGGTLRAASLHQRSARNSA